MSTNIAMGGKDFPNFGDSISDIFYQKLSLKNINRVNFRFDKQHYITVGSIMRFCNQNSIAVGTGFISDNDNLGEGRWGGFDNKVFSKPDKILSVRGPKTREKLLKMGVECPEVYGDPLIILPIVYNEPVILEYDIGMIPHYIDKNNGKFHEVYKSLCNNYSVKIIDIECGPDYEKFIDDINRCRCIISSSLHGVMMGISYGKKTVFTEFSDQVVGGTFKFHDFFESLNIDYNVPNCNDPNLVDKFIGVDKASMVNIGISIINVCPFIEHDRKRYLVCRWIKHCGENY